MAHFILDTSALAKRYVSEVGSSWIRTITDSGSGNYCWIAAITQVELVAALFRRTRIGTLALAQAQQTAQVFHQELGSHFLVVPVRGIVLDEAVRLVQAHPLRAYDGLQLAVALYLHGENRRQGLPALVLVSSDQILNQAAVAEGLLVEDPARHP